MVEHRAHPLVVLAGPTASGKSALALRLALEFGGEIVSCDSVAVYRGMDLGTAKPSPAERALVPHHMIDVFAPDTACTAGDYSRLAREALAGITARHRLPIVVGGTGLYLRALLDGLSPAPPRDDALRTRLRRLADTRGCAYLHRILSRLDSAASQAVHANDRPKIIRALEVIVAARRPITHPWAQGLDPLSGYSILRLGLNPRRPELYERINTRAAAMFDRGLVEETAALVARYGPECQPFTALGYAQAVALLTGKCSREEAIASARQGHRNYAKRQMTWFRRETGIQWIEGCGEDLKTGNAARQLVAEFIEVRAEAPEYRPA